MDCGPAALKCLLEGFGVPVAYGRLREAVQTEIDGTSIDSLTETARALGLDAQQILVPVDHVGHPRAPTLPGIAVVRLPSGANHFAVAWRTSGSFVQVMDPASGRHWLRIEAFRRKLYVHGTRISAAAWRRFASAPHALAVLRHDLRRLGHPRADEIVAEAAGDDSWRSLAALEAAQRMTSALRTKGAIGRGAEAAAFLDSVYAAARRDDPAKHLAIPGAYWSARPAGTLDDGQPALFVRGALLVRVRGRSDGAREAEHPGDRSRRASRTLPTELRAAITEPPARPLRAILAEIAPRERRAALGLVAASLVAALAILVQALVFQSLVLVGARFSLDAQRVGVVAALLAVAVGVLLLEMPLGAAFLRFGRVLETRWRAAFQRRLPLLPERWFSSRPSSDMAERAHGLSVLRGLPALAGRGVRSLFQLVLTAAGLVWLDPAAWPLVIAAALAATLVPLAFQSTLHERELSLRNHHGALGRSYLETLLGLVAVRVHGAERRLRREHEGMLVEWLRAGRKLARATTAARAATTIAGLGAAVLLVLEHVARHPADPGTLLFVYWALSLSALGDQIAQIAEQLPAMRNATLRALEPISARPEPEELAESEELVPEAPEPLLAPAPLLKAAGAASPSLAPDAAVEEPASARSGGIPLSLRGVDVRIGGHPVLSDVDLEIAPGEHVAIVGASGAGKSTLIALLLGFHRASAGVVLADGERLGARATADLRRATAWIDPSVQLFHKSLFENLVYGTGSAGSGELAASVEDANLRDVLEALPEAFETPLGEGGGFLSAGEGQRVRLARAFLRPGVRLALLDEPFRGLDRDTRRDLLARARRRFASATLLCATHDLAETLAFDRVVVLDGGRVVADGAPRELLARARGPYAELVRAERELAETLGGSTSWTRWRVADGRVEVERSGESRGSSETGGPA